MEEPRRTDSVKERQAENYARREVARLDDVRERLGDEVWAESVGESVTNNAIIYSTFEGANLVVEKVLKVLETQIREISSNPQLSQQYVNGVIKELEARRFINDPSQESHQG